MGKAGWATCAAVWLLGAAVPAHAQCPLSLAPPANYAVGSFPNSVAASDFNGDGRPDLAVGNQGSFHVSILLGNAPPNTGTFQPAVNYALGAGPFSIAVGDFNADGRPDLAVAVGDSVSILLGNPPPNAGTFQAAANYAVGFNPRSVAAGDFNGDGRPDLAVANASSNNVSILRGNANGTFQAAVNFATDATPVSVAVGDFNGDGSPDLAVANLNSNNVSILLGNGNGTLQGAVNYAVGQTPRSVAVGDFNADGRPDLAVANFGSNNVSILLGNGPNAGTFHAAVNYAVGASPYSTTVGDFNGDGRSDLAVANSADHNVSILLGNGPPNTGTFQAAVNYAVNNFPYSVTVDDLNADGRPDLAVASASTNTVSVLLNTNTGFPPPGIIQQPASQMVQAGQNASIAITANGFGNTLTYQWRKNGVPVANGGNVSGATLPTLSFTPALLGDFASYDVQVTAPSACGGGTQVSTSAAAILGVTNPCPADFNADGIVDFFDYLDFVAAFSAGC